MFTLTEQQKIKLSEWMREQRKKAIESQRKTITNPSTIIQQSWADGYPYTGAIEGAVTYMFTPTSIGTVIKVKYGLTEETIDLSDYENW